MVQHVRLLSVSYQYRCDISSQSSQLFSAVSFLRAPKVKVGRKPAIRRLDHHEETFVVLTFNNG